MVRVGLSPRELSTAEGRDRGSALAVALVILVMAAALLIPLAALTTTHRQSAANLLDRELARRAAESGVAYFYAQFGADPSYFDSLTAPTADFTMGESSFSLDVLTAGTLPRQWEITVIGRHQTQEYELTAALGQVGTVFEVTGVGSDSTTVLTLDNDSTLAGYNSAVSSYSGGSQATEVAVNGEVYIDDNSTVTGDVSAWGAIVTEDGGNVSGTESENQAVFPWQDRDAAATYWIDRSRDANDNGNLVTVFGGAYTPIAGAENYGDLTVSSGSYRVPPGVYRIRNLELSSSARVTFETDTGPTTLVVVGDGSTQLRVYGGAELEIDPGGSSNPLTTVLGPELVVSIFSAKFGEVAGDTRDSSWYHHILAPIGTGSALMFRAHGGSEVWGRLYAPSRSVLIDGSTWYGTLTAEQVEINNTGIFAVDANNVGGGGAARITQVFQSWSNTAYAESP